MPDVEEVVDCAEGLATTEQVRVVGIQKGLMLSTRGGTGQLNEDPVSIGSIGVIRSPSSPWWTTRLVEQLSDEDAHVLTSEAASGTSAVSLSDVDVVAAHVTPARPRSALRRWNLDFGLNVTPAFGSEVAGRMIARALESVWRQLEPESLRAEPPAAIAVAEPVPDDADWDDSDSSPRWLSMAALSYRGGGVMRRRGHRSSGA